VRDAHRLLAFLAGRGKAPPPEVAGAVVAAARDVGTERWTPEAETAFWAAHATVSALAAPTSATSLDWSSGPQAEQASKRLWFLGLVLMLLIGFAHFQLATLDSIRDNVLRLSAGLQTAEAEHRAALVELQAAEAAASPDPAAVRALQSASETKDIAAEALRAQIASQFDILSDLWIMADTGLFTAMERIDDPARQQRYLFAHGATLLGLMASFVLPSLYGLLGALAFILRRHQSLVASMALTPGDEPSNLVRLVLGALAGIGIGLFMRPGDAPAPGEFMPLTAIALAFLAGYAVELLFVGMDRFVNAFSGGGARGD
jgi:hypothetical protein